MKFIQFILKFMIIFMIRSSLLITNSSPTRYLPRYASVVKINVVLQIWFLARIDKVVQYALFVNWLFGPIAICRKFSYVFMLIHKYAQNENTRFFIKIDLYRSVLGSF